MQAFYPIPHLTGAAVLGRSDQTIALRSSARFLKMCTLSILGRLLYDRLRCLKLMARELPSSRWLARPHGGAGACRDRAPSFLLDRLGEPTWHLSRNRVERRILPSGATTLSPLTPVETMTRRRTIRKRASKDSKSMVYYFGKTRCDGVKVGKELLGSKGKTLAEMTCIGLPVPPGFTISTEVCKEYFGCGEELPSELMQQVRVNVGILEPGGQQTLPGAEITRCCCRSAQVRLFPCPA